MQVRCKKHNQMMNEKVEDFYIIPYCIMCIAQKRIQDEPKQQLSIKVSEQTFGGTHLDGLMGILIILMYTLAFVVVVAALLFFPAYIVAIFVVWIGDWFIHLNEPASYSLEPYKYAIIVVVILIMILVGVLMFLKDRKVPLNRDEKTEDELIEEEIQKMRATVEYQQRRADLYIAKLKKQHDLENSDIRNVDNFNGVRFEEYMGNLFKMDGYSVRKTPASGDNGVDLIIQRNGCKVAVQCKRYKGNVPVSAIQEVYAGKDMYDCDEALVVTNSYFTSPAERMAEKLNVALWDRNELIDQINQIKPVKNEWNEYVKQFYDLSKINNVTI